MPGSWPGLYILHTICSICDCGVCVCVVLGGVAYLGTTMGVSQD